MKIGYWAFKGRGEYIKTVATYLGLEFEEVDYTAPEKWFAEDKQNLGFDFPNLPYLIDGDVKLTESQAITTYLCLKAGKPELLGVGPVGQAQVRMIQEVFGECFQELMKCLFCGEGATEKTAALGKEGAIITKLGQAEAFLGDKDWFTGAISIADIGAAGSIYLMDLLIRSAGGDSLFPKFPKLGGLVQRFFAIPEIAARVSDPAFKAKPTLCPSRLPFPALSE